MQVPAADTPFGPLVESNAIFRYGESAEITAILPIGSLSRLCTVVRLRPDTGLYGANFYQTALIDQWIDWSSFELENHVSAWYYTLLGYRTYDATVS